MYRLRKAITFEAAHKLPNHLGKCGNLHGHVYKVEVFVVGQELKPIGQGRPDEGMLIDFSVLGAALEQVYRQFDHSYLNDLIPIPTAEALARWIYDSVSRYLLSVAEPNVRVEKVRVYEMENAWAEYDTADQDVSSG